MQELNSTTFEHTVNYIRQWGNYASATLLERPCAIFTHPHIEGMIGYHERKSSVVVFGEPLCAPEDRAAFIEAFHKQCHDNKKKITYLNISEPFMDWFVDHWRGSAFGIGDEIIINPERDVRKETGFHARNLRWKHAKSLREGITIHEYIQHDPVLEQKMHQVGQAWLKNRSGAQPCLFPLNIFNNRNEKRWFYALHNNEIIGLLTLNRLNAHNGWVINMLIYTPQAVNSTSAFILMTVLDILREEKCTLLSAGTIPSELGRVAGLGPIGTWVTGTAYPIISKFLNLENKKQFWNQFEPIKKPIFVLSDSRLRVQDFVGIMQALHVIK